MNRRLRNTLIVLGTAGCISMLGSACAENNESVFISGLLAPPINRQNNVCVYSADPSSVQMTRGVVDVYFRTSYNAAFLVASQLAARGDTNDSRAEPNRAVVQGFIVRVTEGSGRELSRFTTLSSGVVPPMQNNLPGYASMPNVRVLDDATLNTVKASLTPGQSKLLVANVKVFGQTLGNSSFESAEFQVPIDVCKGCLVSFAFVDPAEKNLPDTPQHEGCDGAITAPAGGTAPPPPCIAGQDEGLPCQACGINDVECRTPR